MPPARTLASYMYSSAEASAVSSGVDPFEDGKRAGRPRVVKIGPVLVAVGKIWGDAFGKLGSQIVYVTPEGGVVNCRGFIPRAGAKAAFG